MRQWNLTQEAIQETAEAIERWKLQREGRRQCTSRPWASKTGESFLGELQGGKRSGAKEREVEVDVEWRELYRVADPPAGFIHRRSRLPLQIAMDAK